jgi:hypothetical protein
MNNAGGPRPLPPPPGGRGGPRPPPPLGGPRPPPGFGPPRPLGAAAAVQQQQWLVPVPSKKLKAFFWEKLPDMRLGGSVWEGLGPAEWLDWEQLEELFEVVRVCLGAIAGGAGLKEGGGRGECSTGGGGGSVFGGGGGWGLRVA